MSLRTSLPAVNRKSAERTSTTMVSPASAPPSAAPIMMFSETGVSMMRDLPNSSASPVVTRAAPPAVAIASPSISMSGFSRSSSCNALVRASRKVMVVLPTATSETTASDIGSHRLLVDELEHGLGARVVGRVAALEGLTDLRLGLIRDRLEVGVDAQLEQPGAPPGERVAFAPRLNLVLGPVADRVEDPVLTRDVVVDAVGHELDQGGTLPA